MKIKQELAPKEYRKFYNLAKGTFQKENKYRKLKFYTTVISHRYFLCVILIFFIAFFDTFIHLEWLANTIIFLFLILFIITTTNLIKYVINYNKKKRIFQKGEISFNKDGISYRTQSKKIYQRTWDEIEEVLYTKDVIIICSLDQMYFIIKNIDDYEKECKELLKKHKKDIKQINRAITKGIKRLWQQHGLYILGILISFGIYTFWDYYNNCLLDQEMWKTNEAEYQVDYKIYSYEKYGIVESTLKTYFDEFRSSKEKYQENAAITIFSALNIDFLKDEKNRLPEILNSLDEKEKNATDAIHNILNLLDEEKVMKRIEEKQLGEYYNGIFKKYALTEKDEEYKLSWKEEQKSNQEQMNSVRRALEILIQNDQCWYIEENEFFMCDDFIEEYNNLYYNIVNEEEKI